jgi:hypothetical protein
MRQQEPHQFADGDVYFWIEQDSSIMLTAATKHGDPVELTAKEARKIAEALLKTASELEKL